MMLLRSAVAICVLSVGAFAQELPQRFGGTTPNPVPAEGTLDIQYTNPVRANTEITIEVHDGADVGRSIEVRVKVGAGGVGTTEFEVPPGWGSVVLSYPDSADLTVPVSDGTPPSLSAPGSEPITVARAVAPPR